jgi:tetraacyldisaccharide 4'-kinase
MIVPIIHRMMHRHWYGQPKWFIILLPLTFLYRVIMALRTFLYKTGNLTSTTLDVPILVIGNITVGGNGKTPFVIQLSKLMRQKGLKPGIISKGYRGEAVTHEPCLVTANSNPTQVGDEPVVIARHTKSPVAVCTNRVKAAEYLINQHGCTVILSDDGLQDYRLARIITVILIDWQHGFGNGYQLPTGPLRTSPTILKKVQLVAYKTLDAATNPHNAAFHLSIDGIYACQRPDIPIDPNLLKNKKIVAIAGIAHPESFFQSLQKIGLTFTPVTFPNHMAYAPDDVYYPNDTIVIMTEKDAVKCRSFPDNNLYFAKVTCNANGHLTKALLQIIETTLTLTPSRVKNGPVSGESMPNPPNR